MPTLKERFTETEFITKKYMETSRHKYCARCGRKFVYVGQRASYDSFTGKLAYVTYTFACPKRGLFVTWHDKMDFEYRGLDYANT